MDKIKLKYLLNFLVVTITVVAVKCTTDEHCETIPTQIHVTKDEFDDLGRLRRSCTGDVSLNKCEGMCESQVQPSVVTPTGFLKECFCCKENFLRERQVTLTHCYDPDGIRLEDEENAMMEVRIREPAECKCYKCV